MQKVLTNINGIQNIERTSQNEITITTESTKSIRYKFNVDVNKIPTGKTQVGLYRDIIENVETGDVEVVQDHNDITELFAKYLVYRLFINNGIVETIDYDRYFNISQDSSFLSMIKQYKQESTSESFPLPLSKYLGIHSWEVGIGHESWDSPQNEYGFTYNEYGFPIYTTTGSGSSDTYIPYSSLQIYKDTIKKYFSNDNSQYNNTNIIHHNSLICRIPPQLEQYIQFYQINSTQKTYSLYSYRKPVQVFFVLPTQYLLNDNTIVTDPIEILTKLKTGEYVTERVIEWLPYTGRNEIYGINDKLNEMKISYIIPEFIMVQQIFEPFEANFTWREFGILAGFNEFIGVTSGTTNINTIETEENEPNASLMAWMKYNNINTSVSEFHPLVYPRGTFIDYKVHKAINKTRNMRITRQIIFGVLNISSQLL